RRYFIRIPVGVGILCLGVCAALECVEFGGARIDRFSQGLARLEVGHALFGDLDALARARVAPDAWWTPVHREAAEAADLYAMAAHHGVAHGVEDGLDGVL